MTSKELRENRGPMAKRIRELADLANDGNRDFTPEEQQNWDQINTDYSDLTRRIERSEQAEEIEARQVAVVNDHGIGSRSMIGREAAQQRGGHAGPVTAEHRALALQAWMLTQCDHDLRGEHREACRRTGVNPRRKDFDLSFRTDWYPRVRAEMRAQTVGTDTEGGFTVPEGFVNSLERSLLAFGGVRQVADVIRTATGNDLPWPTTNDTGNSGSLLSEAGSVSTTDVTFGSLTLNAYKYTSDFVKVSSELMTDSAFNLERILGEMLGERIARILNTHFTTGDGSSKPKGIVVASSVGKTTATTSVIIADELIDLVHSVDPAYRPNAGFMMHDNTVAALRKLKTTDLQYIWQPGLDSSTPDRLLGANVTVNQDMASSIGSQTKNILYGDFSKYKIRDVAGMRLRRLDERFADTDEVAFVAFSRHDGDLLDSGTDPVKHLITKAV